jgi:hypothetical protein
VRSVRLGSILGGIAVLAALLSVPSASAATLVGDYQLQGSRASSGAGPSLTNIGAGNSFQSDTVMGVSRQVLSFPSGGGLQMSPAGLSTTHYSEVVTFRFATALAPPQDYARILDSGNATSDTGLYDNLGFLDFFEGGNDYQQGTSPVFADNTYATVALVVDSGGTRAYFNGVLKSAFPGLYAVQSNTLRFFRDNDGANSGEESAGAVSCIRVYSGGLTAAEVAAIGASPTCAVPSATPANPTPATTTVTPHKKKCKKKHKKRSAESAKKKKCKKHKKKR